MKELSFVQVRMWLNVTHVQHSQIERDETRSTTKRENEVEQEKQRHYTNYLHVIRWVEYTHTPI